MDRQTMVLFIPILALAIPVLAILFSGLQKVMVLRIRETEARHGAPGHGDDSELQALRDDVEALRREVGELQERADFTERLLARNADPERLQKPS